MKRLWLAAAAATWLAFAGAAAESTRDVIAIDYAKARGLVAAAYQGGQVVVWSFESGQIKTVFNAAGPRTTRNKPLVHFSPDGRRLAYTAEGEGGLVVYDLEGGSSTVVVPSRMLYRGISAFNWSRQQDAMLVAIGRDILLVGANGHVQWQRRLETRALITDVVWYSSEKFYTVATDDSAISLWETISGRIVATAVIDPTVHSTPVKVAWSGDGSSLVAGIQGQSLVLLDSESLKPKKTIPCKCIDFNWSPGRRELAATAPPNIAVLTETGQWTREIRTPFEGPSPVVWADESHLLTASSEATVVLRDVRSPRVVKTFALAADGKAAPR